MREVFLVLFLHLPRKSTVLQFISMLNFPVAEMKKFGFIMTTAPQLPSKRIIHVAIDRFHGNFKGMIGTCLQSAHDLQMSSIAFPPLGTGISNTYDHNFI